MKKRPGKHQDQATDIILNDKEMEALINELVQKAHKGGVSITHLKKAISVIWQKNFYVEPDKLNESEEAFAKKVKNFLAHYENDLIDFHDEYEKDSRYLLKNADYNRKERFFKNLYHIICSMYGVFENEDTITQKLIINFAKTHGFCSYLYNLKLDIIFLNNFISNQLRFCNSKEIPKYSKEYLGYYDSISSSKEFLDFANQYVLSSSKTCQTAIKFIWLIETFF